MAEYDITSPSSEQVKRLARLKQRRHRDDEGLFVVEEMRVFERALAAGFRPDELFLSPDLASSVGDLQYRTISPEALERVSYRKSPTGLIALFSYFGRELADLVPDPRGLYLVAEGIEKPGNLGALLRVCDGAGVSGLILVDSGTDVFNPNVVRASTGALFTVPMARASLDDALGWLGERGVRSIAAHPDASTAFWEADLAGSCAIWIGAEAEGLSKRALEAAGDRVRIPMAGPTDSLNASVAAGILIFESLRQRSGSNDS